MGADRLAAIIGDLPRLTPDERHKISERLRALEALAPTPASPGISRQGPDAAVGELLSAVSAVVLQESGERVNPVILRRAVDGPALREKAAELAEFATKHAATRTRRAALLRLGVELLRRDLARAGMTVTSRTLVACCHQVPAVLDRAFPGYAASGLLGMVVGGAASREDGADG